MTLLQGCKFVLASIELYGSIHRLGEALTPGMGYDAGLPFLGRIFTCPAQDLTIVLIWWLVTCDGLFHVSTVWAVSHARRLRPDDPIPRKREIATSLQFSDFYLPASHWSMPIQLARWMYNDTNSTQHRLYERVQGFALLLPKWLIGNFGIMLFVRGSYVS